MGMYLHMDWKSHPRRAVLAHVTLLAFAALPPLALLLVKVYGDHSVPKGRCEGLGWGCVQSQSDVAALLLLFVLPVMVLWAAGGTVALTLLRRRAGYRARPAIVQGLLPVAPALLLLLLLILV
jgi:hypothetical protein